MSISTPSRPGEPPEPRGRETGQVDADRALADLVLYVAGCSEGDPTFTTARLYRILFYADFTVYVELGSPITHQEYVKQVEGPVPAGGAGVLCALQEQNRLAMARRSCLGQVSERPFALRDPDLGAFSGPQIALLDRVIAELRGTPAHDTSEIGRTFAGWKTALVGEPIPYGSALLDTRPLSAAQVQYGLKLAKSGR